ncbi:MULTISPECIES: hypothetical protein [unclassified Duganella]|uniref:hypothetical protein n=1 Tax=unclassified Duganella TaxID=2636909 RepID=UPI000888B0E6|nr:MULTISPECIES: hypothetical protein [unclassified Duganella]SDF50767.1 hypothetical protein SAMN05216320_101419 [Duganella sp. OV458]SDI76295.1 hypothetical protein SAMN05428973_1011003 [Duganella sp. OV510]
MRSPLNSGALPAVLLAVLLGAGGSAHAARTPAAPAKPQAPQTREASDAERSSFEEYYRQQVPAHVSGGPSLFAPAFDIQRRRGEPWQVIARVDSAPRRLTPDLCRQIRTSYIYNAKAPKGERWTPSAAAPEWYVWLATPKVPCSVAQYTTRMDPAVHPDDVKALIWQHRTLLARARLLFAGNSSCARQRALTFRLAAIEPAPPSNGAPVMVGMVFESDRDTLVRVAVRKSRSEYAAWNVSCAASAD